MFYNAEEGLPWHRLGQALDGLQTGSQVLEAVPALAARVEKEPLFHNGTVVPGQFCTVRQDTGRVLGVVGSKYTVVQNAEIFDILDAICQDKGGPKFTTAGVLWGGRRVWALAKLPDFIEVGDGDIIEPYLMVHNSHDGSGRWGVMQTAIRVVCQNTLSWALTGNGPKAMFRHTGVTDAAKIDTAREALGIVKQELVTTGELYNALAKIEPTDEQVKEVFDVLFPATESKRSELQRERVLRLADDGRGQSGERTGWSILNGITELVDWHNNADSKRDDADDMRANAMLFGSGAKFKAKALATLETVLLK